MRLISEEQKENAEANFLLVKDILVD
jgi:hypothetical protein